MANEEQLSILKQGVEVWNEWRKENHNLEIDLSRAKLRKARLQSINLRGANLYSADFSEADLVEAELGRADLTGSSLRASHLHKSNLIGTCLKSVDLSYADLEGADLREVDLKYTSLIGCNFQKTIIGSTTFGSLDLSMAFGLDDVIHSNPSIISVDTFAISKGKIPEVFLRGCGLSDVDIEYAKLSGLNLSNEGINKILYKIYDLRATQALQISPLFISYSHGDSIFVDKLESQLNKKGVRFWRDIHDMKAGRIETQIDQAISQNRTVLLVLSEHSIKSDWVEHEVRTARGLEKDMGRDVLCPVALDDSWKTSPWPKRVMEQIMEYNILDFSAWEDDSKFEGMFRKLIDGLGLFYKG